MGDENSAPNNGTDAIDVSDGKSSPPPRTLLCRRSCLTSLGARHAGLMRPLAHCVRLLRGRAVLYGPQPIRSAGDRILVSSSTPARVKTLGGIAASVQWRSPYPRAALRRAGALVWFQRRRPFRSRSARRRGDMRREFRAASVACGVRWQSDAAIAVVAVAAGGAPAIVCADGSVYTCAESAVSSAMAHQRASRAAADLGAKATQDPTCGTRHATFTLLSHLGVPFACGCGGFGRFSPHSRGGVVPTLVARRRRTWWEDPARTPSFVTEGVGAFSGDDGGQLGCETGKARCYFRRPLPSSIARRDWPPFEGVLPPKRRPGRF